MGIPRGCAPVRAADVWIFLREHRARLAEKDASRRDIIFITNIKVLFFVQGQCFLVPGSREPVYCFSDKMFSDKIGKFFIVTPLFFLV